MRRALLVLLAVLALCLPVSAQTPGQEDPAEALVEQLPGEARELMESMEEPGDLGSGLESLLLSALGRLDGSLAQGLRLAAVLLCILLLCSAVDLSSLERRGVAVHAAGALGICAAFLGPFQGMLELARQTISQMADYSLLMLPVMASSVAMSGGVKSSGALYAGTLLFSQLLIQLIHGLLMPLVYVYLALATAQAALNSDMLSQLRELIGWLIAKSLKILLYVFVGFLGASGAISGSADAAALKAAKAAISGMVPVVGSILAKASESLLASTGLLRSSVGLVGMLAVLALCLLPFLRVAVQYLLLRLTAAVGGTVGLKSHVGLLKHCASAMGYLLAMCGSVCLLLLISMVCFLKVVV